MNLKTIRLLFAPEEIKNFSWLVVGMVLMGFFEMIGVASVFPFISVVLDVETIHSNFYLSNIYAFFDFRKEQDFLVFLGILVLLLIVISNSYNAFMSWKIVKFTSMQGHHLSKKLLSIYMFQPYVFFIGRHTSDMGKNILSESDRVISGVILPGMLLLSKLMVTVFIIALLVYVDPLMVVNIIIVFGFCYYMIYKIVKNKISDIGQLSAAAITKRFKAVNEAVSGIKIIKLVNGEKTFIDRFSDASVTNAECITKSVLISQMPRYAIEAIAFSGVVLIILIMVVQGDSGEEVLPIISLYALSGYRLMPALQQIYQSITSVRYNMKALDIISQDLSLPKYNIGTNLNRDQCDRKSILFNSNICLKNIDYTYPGSDSKVINNVSLCIEHNTTVGIIGSSGSGKSTLLDLLLGLLSPSSGKMLLDGSETKLFESVVWKRQIGYVPQDIYLIDDTICNNIALSNDGCDTDMDLVIKAARLANIDLFIDGLMDGYDTIVGERGVRLSGGQKQRIGIARALYSKPSILVLDEATSALDLSSESHVVKAINGLNHRMTIIIVAHRLETIKKCDKIHILTNGKIVDSGSYEKLLSNSHDFKLLTDLV